MRYFPKIILKFKKIFFSFFSKKRLIFLFLTLAFFFFLPLTAQGQFGPLSGFLGAAFFTLLLAFLIEVTGAAALLMGLILDFVIGPNFISLSYTNPDENKIIENGLRSTQGLVNMFLVAALLYIALSIALKLGDETAAKKMLARLIFVALIVNFAPVICGLIVDAANIAMNYFFVEIKKGISGALISGVSTFQGGIIGVLFKISSFKGQMEIIIQSIIMIILNFSIAFAFFLFSIIFIVRYLVIWSLVILAPLAFVAWIMPATKKFWDMWWNNFLQWSIVGIPMAFFLYLGSKSLKLLHGSYKGKFPGEIGDELSRLLNETFPYFLVLVFLFLGFTIGLRTSALGASQIISFTKKMGVKTSKLTGRGVGAGIGAVRAIPAVSRAEERIRRGLEGAPVLGRVVGGPGAFERKRAESFNKALQEVGKNPDTPEGNEALRKIASRRAFTLQDRYRRAAAIQTLAERKALTDDLAEHISEAQRFGANIKSIYLARPDLAHNLIDSNTGKPMTIENVMNKIMPSEFYKHVQKEALENPDVVYHAFLDEAKFKMMTKHMSPASKKIVRSTLLDPKRRPSRELTSKEKDLIQKRISQMSAMPEWQWPKEQ